MTLPQAIAAYAQRLRQDGTRTVRLSRAARMGLETLTVAGKWSEAGSGSEQHKTGGQRLPLHRQLPEAPKKESAVAVEAIVVEGATKAEKLAYLQSRVKACRKCAHLASFRTQTVFGVGNPEAELMFVGEAPGFEEDKQGEPFVGPAGQLLTKMIGAMGLSRSQVYIANILKCRPDMPKGAPGNRKPTAEEMRTCLPYVSAQIDVIAPKVIVALGSTAVEGIFGEACKITQMRGKMLEFRGIPVMPTFHPSYLLRNQSPAEKRKVWEDLMQVMEVLGMEISEKQRGYFLSK